MRGGQWIGLLFLLLALVDQARAQEPFYLDFYLNEYKEPVSVRDILADERGYIWLATDQGIYRFNGRDFFSVPDPKEALPRSLCLFQDRIWVGYQDGSLSYWEHDRMVPVSFRWGSPSSPINALRQYKNRFLLLGTQSDGLVIFWEGLGFSWSTDRGLPDPFVYDVALAGSGEWLIPTDKGIGQVYPWAKGGEASVYGMADSLRDNIVRVLKPMDDKGRYYWLGTHERGPAVLDRQDGIILNLSPKTPWTKGQINDILPMESGRAWIGTEGGELIEAFFREDTLSLGHGFLLENKKIYRLIAGRAGLIWAATQQGISPITIEYLAHYPLDGTYRLSRTAALAVDPGDKVWLAQDRKVFRFDRDQAGQPSAMELIAEFPTEVTAMDFDDRGQLWVGTFGSGLFLLRSPAPEAPIPLPWFPEETILDVLAAEDRVWISGLHGVSEMKVEPGYPYLRKVRQFNKQAGLGTDYVYDIFRDSRGALWFATDGAGLVRFDSSGFRHWDSTEGFEGKVSYQVVEDRWGHIWGICLNQGLYRYNGEQWRRFGTADGLQDINLATVAATASGELVAVHEKGIDVWYPRSGQFRNYVRNGNLAIDSLSSTLRLYARDREGAVLIPFGKGLLEFRPIAEKIDISPRVAITSMSLFFEEQGLHQHRFAHDQNHISFQFDGIFFANPDRLHYRYMLEGYNQDWVVTNDPMATFPKLDPGTYRFRVQASGNQSFRSQGETQFAFTIERPFWGRTDFLFAVGLVGLLSIASLVRLRENQIRKLSTLQRERMRFEYENLKSQVNPHFLFNSLNTLTNLIDEDKEAAQQYTSHLSDLYRHLLSYRTQDTLSLREEWEILQNYLFIQKVRFGEALELIGHIPEEIMDEKRIVPLALQMLVENAIKHNVVSARQPLLIYLKVDRDWITLRNPVHPKINPQKGEGLGLANIAARYQLITDRPIQYGLVGDDYIVKLPLL